MLPCREPLKHVGPSNPPTFYQALNRQTSWLGIASVGRINFQEQIIQKWRYHLTRLVHWSTCLKFFMVVRVVERVLDKRVGFCLEYNHSSVFVYTMPPAFWWVYLEFIYNHTFLYYFGSLSGLICTRRRFRSWTNILDVPHYWKGKRGNASLDFNNLQQPVASPLIECICQQIFKSNSMVLSYIKLEDSWRPLDSIRHILDH